jgi:hypothetical protein
VVVSQFFVAPLSQYDFLKVHSKEVKIVGFYLQGTPEVQNKQPECHIHM